jgi:putative tryptophan/tyrosine transport system substrate-binding protein
MRRRDFIALVSGASVIWPDLAYPQLEATPTIGFLNSASPGGFTRFVAAFHQGLGDTGYVEGRNLIVEYRWAAGQYDRLPALVDDLIRRQVNLIAATGGIVSALAAKAATSTIPILFVSGFDPVDIGLVASINRPGGNATGVNVYTTELMQKRLELMRELVPGITTIALLVNPDTAVAKYEISDIRKAVSDAGLQLLVLEAKTERDFEPAFASIKARESVLLVSADPFFTGRHVQIVVLAARHRVHASYPWREYVDAGGLMSYGPSITWAYRQIGAYAGRILKGAKPGDLPVQMPTTFELALNLNTSKAFSLEVPPRFLALVDQVIE